MKRKKHKKDTKTKANLRKRIRDTENGYLSHWESKIRGSLHDDEIQEYMKRETDV